MSGQAGRQAVHEWNRDRKADTRAAAKTERMAGTHTHRGMSRAMGPPAAFLRLYELNLGAFQDRLDDLFELLYDLASPFFD